MAWLAAAACCLTLPVSAAAGANRWTLVRQWGSRGSGPGQFNVPAAIAVDYASGNVYVADEYNSRIEEFTGSGAFIRSIGGPGPGPGEFGLVGGVALANCQFLGCSLNGPVDAAPELIATDKGGDRAVEFTADGRYLATISGQGGCGYGPYECFAAPAGIASAPDYRGSNPHPVFFFVNQSGDDLWSADLPYATFRACGTAGSAAGQFDQPVAVAAWDPGHIFVSDSANNRVEMIRALPAPPPSSTGVKRGCPVSRRWAVAQPAGIAVFPGIPGSLDLGGRIPRWTGNVLVAAGAARRIEVFRSSGALLGSFGDAGFRGLAVTPTGDVYATAGNLVQQWRPPIPTTAILAPRPRQWTNTLHPRLLVASDQPGTKLCTILGPTFAHGAETGRCGVLLAHPHLAPDTTYLLRAQATNRQGYSSRSIPQVEFTVDTDTPLTRIEKVSGPSREQGGGIVYTTSTPTLYFSSQESQFARRYESYAFPFGAPIYAEQPPPVLYAYTCQVDSRAPVRCQSPFTPPPLANGRHTITIRAADQAGNRYKLAYGVNVGAPPPACRGIYCIPPPPGH